MISHKKVIKCIECDWLKGTGIGWDVRECSHEACFKRELVENYTFQRALYGEEYKTTTERIKDYEVLNAFNNCKYFKEKKKSWWKIW